MKKNTIIIAVLIIIITAIFVTLARNKYKINKKNEAIDRTKIPVSVTTQKAVLGELLSSSNYPATIKAQNEANIFSQISGIISHLNLELGQVVSKGQVIGEIDTRTLVINLQIAEAAYKTAKLNKAKLLDDYKRAEDLFKHKAGTEANMINAKFSSDKANIDCENALHQVKFNKQQIANANIISPLSGIVNVKNSKEGEFISPSMTIGSITNISTVKATAFVNQSLVYSLSIGQTVNVNASALATNFSGKIQYISPKADANHNYQIDVLVSNNGTVRLKPGTDVELQFNTKSSNSILIPILALVADRKESFVFVIENGISKGRTVKIGGSNNEKVQVLSGLEENDEVVVNGQINLFDGCKVKVLNK
ncbi:MULTISPECIES: efflux RND transporter periplasmic adaptor subunit [unclassified Chryseobacterium]|uniref:efflux RND transporter periplasmic adaptor subunit n=1 Tax=unclassified Chryseobacterium TaxID=2593645 RepID=UPI000D379825|nr:MULTISPECIES: efflux RND transporter periplasmic adaptor subunit [unclassified Chryseobacterium]PTT76958.1 efflux transporter periplasmic adaptor subunit [Chryseobacterium sp. HMWF001]PVV59928.1 efflux RND transporter periplasmic adaptor subunit [Chryseobacterium sp. HMWF035]